MPTTISGVSAQQVAIANPFQTENNRQTQELQARERETARNQSARETGQTRPDNQNNRTQVQTASASEEQTQRSAGREQGRGSIVDISV